MKAVWLVSLAASALPMLALAGMALSANVDLKLFVRMAATPFMLALPIVLGAATVLGLPLTFVLKRFNCESASAYVSVGVIAGALIPLVALMIVGGLEAAWFAPFGATGGGVTGWVWWLSRREKRGAARAAS